MDLGRNPGRARSHRRRRSRGLRLLFDLRLDFDHAEVAFGLDRGKRLAGRRFKVENVVVCGDGAKLVGVPWNDRVAVFLSGRRMLWGDVAFNGPDTNRASAPL